MKTAESKSSARQPQNEASSSFNQTQKPKFFSKQNSAASPFFSKQTSNSSQSQSSTRKPPFFSPLPVPPLQAKCVECAAQERSPLEMKTPMVQRTPAFESAEGIQAKTAPNPEVPLQRFFKAKELTSKDEAIAPTPHIQRIPAFSSADDSGEGEDGNGELPLVQLRLTIGQPNDSYEQEADAMAEQVTARSRERIEETPKTLNSSKSQVISRKPQSLMLQSQGHPSLASKPLESRLQQAKGNGTSLDTETRGEMEDAFSADFGHIQIHTGQEATSLNQSLGAKAFTHGNNIFFNSGEYQPQSTQGKHLLAHELTHTIQQGHGVQRKVKDTPDIQRVADAPGNQPTVSSEVVDLSSSSFKPSEKVKGEIETQGRKGLDVRTKINGVTSEGLVKVKLDRQGNYVSTSQGSMPLLNPWAKQLGGMYVNFSVKNNKISEGYASLTKQGGSRNDWLKALKQNSAALGGLGLKVGKLPTPVNQLENGKLTLGVKDLNVEMGGFLDAKFNLSLENTKKPTIDATAKINVKGIAQGTLKLDNREEKLTGEVILAVDYKSFNGEAKIAYKKDGSVDIGGKAAYNANKLSGEINFVATDLQTANKFAKDAIAAAGGKENVQKAPSPAPVPVAKTGSRERALAATGQLGFNLTTWFVGTVNVVVDGRGEITVIGRINPPAEIELFPQKNWEEEIITLEARAYYGVPLVGNLNVFANIGLYALAKLGPAKIYNIEVLGTYSTDPDIQRNIQISGSLNISALGLEDFPSGG